MAAIVVDHSESPNFEPKNLLHITSEEHEMGAAELCSQHLYGECAPSEEPLCDTKITGEELLVKGYMQYG